MPGLKDDTHANLTRLLRERNEKPERADEIDAEIMHNFAAERAVFVLDMCGFSRTVQAKGIIHYLALIERVNRLATPSIRENYGLIIKNEADNIFAVFETSDDAVKAALDIMRQLRAVNDVLPADQEVDVSIGIGNGEILIIEQSDMWGDEVNLASKLGEDLAEAGEILLTRAAHDKMQDKRRRMTEQSLSVSGVTIDCFKVDL